MSEFAVGDHEWGLRPGGIATPGSMRRNVPPADLKK